MPPGVAGFSNEPSAAYLGGVGARWRSLLLDLRGATGAGAKMRLLAGHAFPDPAYMRSAYGTTGPTTLTAAYVRRAAGGLWRLLAAGGARSSDSHVEQAFKPAGDKTSKWR